MYIIRKKGVPASIAKELFSSKKKRKTATDAKNDDNFEAKKEDDENEEDDMEMPPVKLEFLTYES